MHQQVLEGTGIPSDVNNIVVPTQHGLPPFITGNKGHPIEDPESDSESVSSSVKCKKKLKSGMVALPTDIKTLQIWLHYNLSFGFITVAVQFHQLSFE